MLICEEQRVSRVRRVRIMHVSEKLLLNELPLNSI
jgi:hypothetical protein